MVKRKGLFVLRLFKSAVSAVEVMTCSVGWYALMINAEQIFIESIWSYPISS
jgi:hypothetical protein